jgi:hypothetical protein
MSDPFLVYLLEAYVIASSQIQFQAGYCLHFIVSLGLDEALIIELIGVIDRIKINNNPPNAL